MGGPRSRRFWHWNKKETTHDMRSIDVRRWALEGFGDPGRDVGWQWNVNGEKVRSIRARAEIDRVGPIADVPDAMPRQRLKKWNSQCARVSNSVILADTAIGSTARFGDTVCALPSFTEGAVRVSSLPSTRIPFEAEMQLFGQPAASSSGIRNDALTGVSDSST